MLPKSCLRRRKGRSFPVGETHVCIFRVNAFRPFRGSNEAGQSLLLLLLLGESGESSEVGREGVIEVFRSLKSSVFPWVSKPDVEPPRGECVTVVASLNTGIWALLCGYSSLLLELLDPAISPLSLWKIFSSLFEMFHEQQRYKRVLDIIGHEGQRKV